MAKHTALKDLKNGYKELLQSDWKQGDASLGDGCHCMLTALGDSTSPSIRLAVVFLAKACVGEDVVKMDIDLNDAHQIIMKTNDGKKFTRLKALARYRKAITLAGKGR